MNCIRTEYVPCTWSVCQPGGAQATEDARTKAWQPSVTLSFHGVPNSDPRAPVAPLVSPHLSLFLAQPMLFVTTFWGRPEILSHKPPKGLLPFSSTPFFADWVAICPVATIILPTLHTYDLLFQSFFYFILHCPSSSTRRSSRDCPLPGPIPGDVSPYKSSLPQPPPQRTRDSNMRRNCLDA